MIFFTSPLEFTTEPDLLFLLAARQSVQAPSALAPQRRFEPVVLASTPLTKKTNLAICLF